MRMTINSLTNNFRNIIFRSNDIRISLSKSKNIRINIVRIIPINDLYIFTISDNIRIHIIILRIDIIKINIISLGNRIRNEIIKIIINPINNIQINIKNVIHILRTGYRILIIRITSFRNKIAMVFLT